MLEVNGMDAAGLQGPRGAGDVDRHVREHESPMRNRQVNIGGEQLNCRQYRTIRASQSPGGNTSSGQTDPCHDR